MNGESLEARSDRMVSIFVVLITVPTNNGDLKDTLVSSLIGESVKGVLGERGRGP